MDLDPSERRLARLAVVAALAGAAIGFAWNRVGRAVDAEVVGFEDVRRETDNGAGNAATYEVAMPVLRYTVDRAPVERVVDNTYVFATHAPGDRVTARLAHGGLVVDDLWNDILRTLLGAACGLIAMLPAVLREAVRG
jgi:hypothetical protein